jgi:hypothetical protein
MQIVQKPAPAKSELMHYKSGDIAVIEAIKSPRINQLNDDELKESFRYVMLLVGIRAKNLPVDIEKIVLLNYVRKYFGLMANQEFKIAFELAVAGELGLKDEEVNCYDNFSAIYVGKILKAYRKYAAAVIDFAERRKQEVKPALPPPDFKKAELVDVFYQDFLKGEFNLKLISGIVYDTALKHCELKIGHADLMQLIADAKAYVLDDYSMRLANISPLREESRYAQILEMKKGLEKMHIGLVCNNDDVNQYAKALCLQFWFEEQKKKGIKKIV